jgi:hypothetical protein
MTEDRAAAEVSAPVADFLRQFGSGGYRNWTRKPARLPPDRGTRPRASSGP